MLRLSFGHHQVSPTLITSISFWYPADRPCFESKQNCIYAHFHTITDVEYIVFISLIHDVTNSDYVIVELKFIASEFMQVFKFLLVE